jgi:hypothetical protein
MYCPASATTTIPMAQAPTTRTFSYAGVFEIDQRLTSFYRPNGMTDMNRRAAFMVWGREMMAAHMREAGDVVQVLRQVNTLFAVRVLL